MSLQQGKTKKPCSSPKFIRKQEEAKDKIMIEIDLEITIGKDKTLDKIGIEMMIGGMGICKISVELMAEIEVGEVLPEAIVVIIVGQEKEVYPPEGIIVIIIIGKMATLDLDQGLEVDPTPE